MDTPQRSLVKTLSYRAVGAVVTAAVAWVVTGEVRVAALIGGADTVAKLIAYYVHERAWNRIPAGRVASSEGWSRRLAVPAATQEGGIIQ